jgi:uncharacterized protein (TIGR02246 family)
MGEEQGVSDAYTRLFGALNAADLDATIACFEPRACFKSKSGRIARGAAELREVYRITFAGKPRMEFTIRKVIPAGDDLALVVVEWRSKAVSAAGEVRQLAATAADILRRQPDGAWKFVLDNPYGIA